MDTKNIMIVGVGGQGSLLASKLLGYLLLKVMTSRSAKFTECPRGAAVSLLT